MDFLNDPTFQLLAGIAAGGFALIVINNFIKSAKAAAKVEKDKEMSRRMTRPAGTKEGRRK